MRPFLTVALLCLAAGCASKAAPEPIWVGHLAPLSGADREQGEASIRPVQVVLEKAIEDRFTVVGRSVGVRHVDSASGTARAEATRLLAVNRVSALIVGPGVTEVEEILAAARAHSAPVIVLSELARPPDYPDVIRLGPDPAARGEALAKVAKEKLKASSAVLVVDAENPVWVALADAFEAQWRKGKGRSRRLDLAALSRDPAARKQLAASPPDVYLVATPAARLGDPKTHLGELLADRVVLLGEEGAPLDPEVRAGKKVKALYWATPWHTFSEEGKELLQLLEKRQGGAVPPAALLAVDGINLVMQGLKDAKSADRAKLREALGAISEFDGIGGRIVWRDGRPRRTLYVVRSGGTLVETIQVKE